MNKLLVCLLCFISSGHILGSNIVYNVKHTGNMVFFGDQNPVIDMNIYNNYRSEPVSCNIKCTVKTDSGDTVSHLRQKVWIHPGDSASIAFSFYSPEPGFYRVLLEDGDKYIKEVNICYEPEKIYTLYPGDSGPSRFWKELNRKNVYKSPQYKIVRLKDKRAWSRKAYLVTIKCSGGEMLRGYYFVPLKTDGAVARVRMLYGNKPDMEREKRYKGKYIDFVLPVDSVAVQDSLFYVNTVFKYLAAVDFLSSRNEVETGKVFAVGEGITGGIALAAAVVDTAGIEAVAVYNPFINERGLGSGSNMLLERITPLLKCPVLFGMGLQDSIASPRRIFDAYNVIDSYKEYYIFPMSSGEEHSNWDALKNNFLMKYSAGH